MITLDRTVHTVGRGRQALVIHHSFDEFFSQLEREWFVPSSGGTIDPLDTRPKHALVFAAPKLVTFFFSAAPSSFFSPPSSSLANFIFFFPYSLFQS